MSLHVDRLADDASVSVPLPPDAARKVLRRYWRLEGGLTRLACERDDMFRVDVEGRGRFVLRLSNPADDLSRARMQAEALIHVRRTDDRLPVPAPMADIDGDPLPEVNCGENMPRLARLSPYLAGLPLAAIPRSPAQRHAVGAVLAFLVHALDGFAHEGLERPIVWDLACAGSLYPLAQGGAPAGVDGGRWRAVGQELERFASAIAPRLAALPAQAIHNDFNPHNLLVDAESPDRISGVLDFGDMVRGAPIADLAIACSYHARDGVSAVADIVKAFHRVRALHDAEIGLLHELMTARLAATVAITHHRAVRHPGNADYILRNAPAAWAGLEVLAAIDRDALTTQLVAACGTLYV